MVVDIPPWKPLVGEFREAIGAWEAAWVASDGGVSDAVGVLEIGADGHALVDIAFAGAGPRGALRTMGWIDLEEALVGLVGRRDDALVSVQGACRLDGRLLACFVDVDGDDWELWFRRA